MPYATRKDLEELYGDRLVSMLADLRDMLDAERDIDGDGQITNDDRRLIEAKAQTEIDDRINKALDAATAEIDAYVCVKYPLPLPTTPRILINVCRDIAIYRLALTERTNEMRQRYEDAVEFLGKISSGKAMLAFPGVVNLAGPGGPQNVPAPKPRSTLVFRTRRGD